MKLTGGTGSYAPIKKSDYKIKTAFIGDLSLQDKYWDIFGNEET